MRRTEQLQGLRLMNTIDRCVARPAPAKDLPFLMAVEEVNLSSARSFVATGRIERGTVKGGDKMEIVGLKKTARAACISVKVVGTRRKRGQAGDRVECTIERVGRGAVKPGQVLAAPGTMTAYPRFSAGCLIATNENGDRYGPFEGNKKLEFCFRTAVVKGTVFEDKDDLTVGEELELDPPRNMVIFRVELDAPVAMDTGQRLTVLEDGHVVGTGYVTGIHVDDPVNDPYPRYKWGYHDSDY